MMKKFLLTLLFIILISQPCNAFCFSGVCKDENAVRRVINSQVKYANKTNLEKFISTYDENYTSADGFNLEIYTKLINDIWSTYNGVKYGIEIKNIKVANNRATVEVIEKSEAKLFLSKAYQGTLHSSANSIYHLKKNNQNRWKVVSDEVLDETTTLLYGRAQELEIKLTAPEVIEANKDYIAMLEFEPPRGLMAIASLATDLVEYPQKPTKEVFRVLPDDNILERIFTSNNQKLNEYVVASIGLTESKVTDLSINLTLVGFGYVIKRVNVNQENTGGVNVKN